MQGENHAVAGLLQETGLPQSAQVDPLATQSSMAGGFWREGDMKTCVFYHFFCFW